MNPDISSAASAASSPRLPTSPPARSHACRSSSDVMTPNVTGTPVRREGDPPTADEAVNEAYDGSGITYGAGFTAVSTLNGALVRPHDIRVGRNPAMAIAGGDGTADSIGVVRATARERHSTELTMHYETNVSRVIPMLLANERLAYRESPEPHFRTRGPKTRREFLNLLAWNGGSRA